MGPSPRGRRGGQNMCGIGLPELRWGRGSRHYWRQPSVCGGGGREVSPGAGYEFSHFGTGPTRGSQLLHRGDCSVIFDQCSATLAVSGEIVAARAQRPPIDLCSAPPAEMLILEDLRRRRSEPREYKSGPGKTSQPPPQTDLGCLQTSPPRLAQVWRASRLIGS